MTAGPKRPVDTADAEGFARRWSKRKQAARAGMEVDAPPAEQPLPEPIAPPAPVLTDKDMPPIESLTEDSDVSGFFSPGVSEELRRLALNKLFHLPSFNTRCPLDSEYYDMANLTPLGSIITHDMREQWAREAAQLAEKALDKALDGKDAATPATAPDTAAQTEIQTKPETDSVIASEAKQSDSAAVIPSIARDLD